MSTERPGIRDTGEKGKKDMTDLSICKYRETSNKIQLHRHHGLITPVVSTTSTTWTEGNPAKSTDIDTLQTRNPPPPPPPPMVIGEWALVFLVRNFAHLSKALTCPGQTVLELKDFDLFTRNQRVSNLERDAREKQCNRSDKIRHTCCSISRTLNSCELSFA